MGSFNIRCDVTNSAIAEGDEMVVVFFTEGVNSDWIKPSPLMFRVVGQYNDYGRILLDWEDPINQIVLDYLNGPCANTFDKIRDLPLAELPKDNHELLEYLVWEGAMDFVLSANVDPTKYIDCSNKYHPSASGDRDVTTKRCVMHRYAYDHLVSMRTFNEPEWFNEKQIPDDRLIEATISSFGEDIRRNELSERLTKIERGSPTKEDLDALAEYCELQRKLLQGMLSSTDGDPRRKMQVDSLSGRNTGDLSCYGSYVSSEFGLYINERICAAIKDGDREEAERLIKYMWDHLDFVLGMRTSNIEFNHTKTFAFEQWTSSYTLERKVAFLEAQLEFERNRLKRYEKAED